MVLVGKRWGQRLYLHTGMAACALGLVFALAGHALAFVLPLALYAPYHWKAYRQLVAIDHGRELNQVLGMTARNMLAYGLAVAIGLLM